ncbi:MAG: 1-phosphofructokinase family hexose kinase [Ferruginibacter sp.]
MPGIITVTVNPCIDISAKVPVLIPERKLHCSAMKKEPGGGGINVSRVLKRLGNNSTAVYLAGGYTGEYFSKMLHAEKVNTLVIETVNHTRENFVVAEGSTNLQYRFGMPGPFIEEKEWKQCLDQLSSLQDIGYIVASGSLAEGVPEDFFARVARIAKQKNAKMILDTSGIALAAALKETIYMIKPNLGELSFISGIKQLDKDSAIGAARSIITKKQCEVVVVSMGANGALLITGTIAEHIMAPDVKIKSTVGAGDSMVAGIVFALSNNKTYKEALQYGVACGTAATMNEGTSLCNVDDVDYLFELTCKQ